MTCPVMYDAAGMQRKAASAATSSGSPTRPAGVRARIFSSRGGSLSTGSASGVRMYHGATALTRILSRAHSAASPRVRCATAALVMAYGVPVPRFRKEATETTLTIEASPDARSSG